VQIQVLTPCPQQQHTCVPAKEIFSFDIVTATKTGVSSSEEAATNLTPQRHKYKPLNQKYFLGTYCF
jgi:hypothetical protein